VARLSLPLSFTTPEAPSESVVVVSGTAGGAQVDADLAEAETDITLGRQAAPATPTPSPRAETPVDADGKPHPTGRAILLALGVLAVGNLFAVTLSSVLNNWAIFKRGWPMELLLAGGALFLMMGATQSIWLSIPASTVFSNGIILAYCTFTGNWAHWAFLWVVEPWVVAGSVMVSRLLAKQPAQAHRISHLLGWAGGITALFSVVAVQLSALALDLLSGIIAWLR
jgi:hypothetical protein